MPTEAPERPKYGLAKKDRDGYRIANIPLAEDVFNHIVNFEDAWNQDWWRVEDDESACGTAMCAAGWAGVIVPAITYRFALQDISEDADRSERDKLLELVDAPAAARRRGLTGPIRIEQAATEYLGVDMGQKSLNFEFFTGGNSLLELRDYIDQARCALGGEGRDFKAEPVPVLKTGKGSKPVKDRVRRFNQRARDGIVAIERELTAKQRKAYGVPKPAYTLND